MAFLNRKSPGSRFVLGLFHALCYIEAEQGGNMQIVLESIVLVLPIFWFVYCKLSHRWAKSKGGRIALSVIVTVLASYALCMALGLFLLSCFPEYCYGL